MKILLENNQLCLEVSKFGGHIDRLYNKETRFEHYWAYDPELWPRRTSVCFPICGRLKDDEYVYNGERYNLPMHGFLREQLFEIATQSGTHVVFSMESSENSRKNYPFDFIFLLEYRLEGNSLIAIYTVKNTGTTQMPFSTGSHYTYRIPVSNSEIFDDYEFVFSKVQKASRFIIENGQITGKSTDFFMGRDRIPLKGLFGKGSVTLDCTELTDSQVSLLNRKTGTHTTVQFDGYHFCVLWAPKDQSPFVCIEPWTGIAHTNANDINICSKLGMVLLNPGEQRKFCQKIILD
jgi:galactose mutarotase-like enzyme